MRLKGDEFDLVVRGLWVAGLPYRMIAGALGVTRGKVERSVARIRPDRSRMSDEDRQWQVDTIRQILAGRGLLENFDWRIRPLGERGGAQDTRPKTAAENRQLEPADKRKADIGIVALTSPIEWMLHKMKFESDDDSPGAGEHRYQAALKLRDLFESANAGGPSGASFSDATTPGGAHQANAAMAHRIDVARKIVQVQTAMAREQYAMLVQLVAFDVFLWEYVPTAERQSVFDGINAALDIAADEFGLVVKRRRDPGISTWRAP